MSAASFLSSKIVVLEKEPQIPSIASVLSAVLLLEGVAERGPINDPQLVTSFDEYEQIFGGFGSANDMTMAVYGFFYNQGIFAWCNRVVHYTDLTDPTAHTAAKGTVTLATAGNSAAPAEVGPSGVAPFDLIADAGIPEDDLLGGLTFLIDAGSGDDNALFSAARTGITETATYPWANGTEKTMGITIDGGTEQTVTIAAGTLDAEDVANSINATLVGGRAVVSAGHVTLYSDVIGTDGTIQVTDEGTANSTLGFPTTLAEGTGLVGNIRAVTIAEVKSVVEAATANVTVVDNGDGTLTMKTEATGATETIQVSASSDFNLGLDTDLHSGSDSASQNTLRVDGKYYGDYTDDITIKVENATSGDADEFNLKVIKGGVVKEVFPNIDITTAETVINDVNSGSDYIAVVDLSASGTTEVRRPVNVTTSAMTGGDAGTTGIADADYVGNVAGPTGLYAFDRVTNGTMLVIPGASASLSLSMLEYAAAHRDGEIFCLLDPPASQTASQMVSHVSSLLENTNGEFGAIYWPRIKVPNPQQSVFGTDDYVTVPPAAWIAGVCSRNDKKLGGVYEAPAGVGGGYGVILGMRGVEDDPGGSSRHPVLDENTRDLVYPKRINPITKLETTSWHIDGSRTLKSTGSFPSVGERRGVIFIEKTVKDSLIIFKHRFNNAANRLKVKNLIERFLKQEMKYGAFRTEDPATAFFVDVSDQLNPTSLARQGKMRVRVGLATNSPIEWIILEFAQDTRGLEEAA